MGSRRSRHLLAQLPALRQWKDCPRLSNSNRVIAPFHAMRQNSLISLFTFIPFWETGSSIEPCRTEPPAQRPPKGPREQRETLPSTRAPVLRVAIYGQDEGDTTPDTERDWYGVFLVRFSPLIKYRLSIVQCSSKYSRTSGSHGYHVGCNLILYHVHVVSFPGKKKSIENFGKS